jgi:acylphosphatase
MKLKIKITGPKVHEVGYRYFLMSNAIDMGLEGFHARNKTGGKMPEVIALVEGDEEIIADYTKLVETKSLSIQRYRGFLLRIMRAIL